MKKDRKESCDILCWANITPQKKDSIIDYLIFLNQLCVRQNLRFVIRFSGEPSEHISEYLDSFKLEYTVLSRKSFQSPIVFLRELYRLRPRIVHFHLISPTSILATLTFCSTCEATISSYHSSISYSEPKLPNNKFFEKLSSLRRRFLSQNTSLYLPVSNYVNAYLSERCQLGPDKVKTLLHGIDLNRFRKISPSEQQFSYHELLKKIKGKKLITYVGQLTEEKGFHLVLDVIKKIKVDVPDVMFCVIGDGPLKDKAIAYSEDQYLEYLGVRDDQEQVYSISYATIVPSIWQEALGLTVIEAQACGAPVIASRIGGIPEIVSDDESGILVPPSDPVALENAIRYLLMNPSVRNRYSKNARGKTKQFDLRQMVKQTVDYYQSFLSEK